jgi:hypothetical protein
MSDNKEPFVEYELHVSAITGRDRKSKFKVVELARVKPDVVLGDVEVRDLAHRKLAELQARKGKWQVISRPITIEQVEGAVIRSFDLMNFTHVCQGVV